MKKFLLLLLLAVTSMPIWAQDIIVTNESERIDANITEVSDTEVKYKKKENPNGPTFVISTAKISSIIYKNGDVQTFKQTAPEKGGTNGTIKTVREAEDIVFIPGQKIERSDKRNKYHYGDIELDESLYKDFLKLTCSDAYKSYNTGEAFIWTGCFLGGAGLGLMLGSLRYVGRDDLTAWGCCFGVGTALAVGGGVGFIVGGANKQSKALSIFNNQCASSLNYKQALTLRVGVTQNGLGLTLNF